MKRLIEEALVAADELGLVEVAIDLSSALGKLDQSASSSEREEPTDDVQQF